MAQPNKVDEALFVQVAAKDGVMTITLNRPAQGNALRLSMYGRIADALRQAAKNDAVEVVIITGNGKFFSTGADVAEAAERVMKGEGIEQLGPNIRAFPAELSRVMIDFPKVLVAAVNGPVIGYPAAQLGLYDLVFVSEAATYQVPLLQLGLVPEACSSYTLLRTVGRAMANDILLTGRTLSAAEMVAFGIASRVIPQQNFLADVFKLVVTEGCATCAPSSMLNAKRLMWARELKRMAESNDEETRALIAQFESGEPMERFSKKFASMKAKAKL